MKKKKDFVTYEEKYLLAELIETQNALAAAYSSFEYVTEPDLIDSCIFRVNSAQMRYKFLLEKARESGLIITCDAPVYQR